MTYARKCPNNHNFDVICKVDERNNSYPCPECGEESKRVFTAPQVVWLMAPGESYMDRIDLAKIWHPIEKAKGLNEIGT